MTFSVKVTTDLFEPELPLGSYAIIDPDREPKNGDLVLARLRLSEGQDYQMLLPYRSFGRDGRGRFCKPGDPRERFSLTIFSYTRANVASGQVTILGTVTDWLPERNPKRVMSSYRRPATSMVAPTPC
jgi:hypothetical protein